MTIDYKKKYISHKKNMRRRKKATQVLFGKNGTKKPVVEEVNKVGTNYGDIKTKYNKIY